MKQDMRSLDRRSMNSIFAPLDPAEPLPRELLLEKSRFHPFQGDLPWGRVAIFLWIPALLTALVIFTWVIRSL
jgi:hypothetical protein